MTQNTTEGIRLNKFISDAGICSRREADKLIEQGRVLVNGKLPEVGARIKGKDKIQVDGKTLQWNQVAPVYLALNKPAGIETTTDLSQRDNIIRFVNYPERIFPIGRLDKDSEGLIFLTNDGDIVNKILRAGNKHEKEYIVTVDKPINEDFVQRMSSGVSILGVNTKKCFVEQLGANKFRIILTQGMNRQIRRMTETLGYEVQTLQRIRIMNITLAKLPLGQWRELTDDEIATIQSQVADSAKTEEGSVSKKKAATNQTSSSQPGRKKTTTSNRPARKEGGAGKKSNFGASDSKVGRGQRGASKGPGAKKSGGKSSAGARGASRNAPAAKGGGRKRR
ncbi:23S rRNA pseudouridine(2604) synthase RluF [Pontibacter sp. HSC-14F20]|uniref:23S rRNA pseudouridine(2604) synthase RluF n=1 Tax=Pontibacter sp. HSC-14F20 TaxID=2864136 RepID=UPI001C73D83E|nr:23S rRNA pseudouridine(2604) synthase RluF [Pontibacter sp. HSC-14F20]MBX0332429.1 23S rRNA pseudouridine(2604) synthase RluF [Pontibacter sp. HSC-14F20]